MATRKSVNTQIKEAELPVAAAEEVTEGSIWDEMVEIYVPRKPRGEDQEYWIAINGRSVYIPANGTVQKIRRPFAEALQNKLEADKIADRTLDEIEVKDPITNPHKD